MKKYNSGYPSLKAISLLSSFLLLCFSSYTQPSCTGAPIEVITTDYSGEGSLSEAINTANFCDGPDTIVFNLPDSERNADGKFVIQVQDNLPTIFDNGTVIDGTTQPGYSFGEIVIDGFAGGPNDNKLFNAFFVDDAGGIEIYGLHITEFVIPIDAGVIGNIIIGSEEKGNIITRYDSIGIQLNFITAFDQSLIQGNQIGIDDTGVVDGEGAIGILLNGAVVSPETPLLLGGTQSNGGNVISGNRLVQIYLVNEAENVRISGNKLGTNLEGLNLPLGLEQDTTQNIGILIQTLSTDLFLDDITIGGDELGEGNIIAFNRFGLALLGTTIRRNAILRNRIHCATQAGIILLQGANQNKEAPIIISATNQLIQGVANSLDVVEVFLNTPEDCFNNQSSQGKIFLGRARADQQGVWNLPGNFLINRDAGDCVTATATDPDGNTSGYSECLSIEFEEPTRDSLDVPNAFSPNDDGSNDRWRIKNLTTLFPNNELQVFNRWGNQVYTAKPFPINGWDGRTEEGNPLDIGTYFFILRLNDQERQEEVVKGSVTIIK